MIRRSDSSKQRRDGLKNLIVVPEIWNPVRIELYYDLARKLLVQAQHSRSIAAAQLNLCYIDYRKFIDLIVNKLPKHNGYKLPANAPNISWGNKAAKDALVELENIASEMDREEDKKLEVESSMNLIDEFDDLSVGQTSSVPQVATSATPQVDYANLLKILEIPQPQNDSVGKQVALPKAVDVSSVVISSQPSSSSQLSFTLAEFTKLPSTGAVELRLAPSNTFLFGQDDFHVAFSVFLRNIPIPLQMTPPALETNRCFFLHLGVATSIHPFVLQSVFRQVAQVMLDNPNLDVIGRDALSSVVERAGLVDANALYFLWPQEFKKFRICLVSGDVTQPIFSSFCSEAPCADRRDIVMRCDMSHFTLLRSFGASGQDVVGGLLRDAQAAQRVVQCHVIPAARSCWSILEVVQKLLT